VARSQRSISKEAPRAAELNVPAVQSSTRRDEAAHLLRQSLLRGDLRPGQRLKEVELTAALNITRPTLREAMGQLIHEGMLVQVPYKGVSVAEFSAFEFLDVANVRFALESTAAIQIAAQSDARGIEQLRAALDVHLNAIENGDEVEADMTHLAFHQTMYEAAESPLLVRIWPLIAARIQMAITVDQAARRDLVRDRDLHVRLVDVIEDGDEAAIVEEVRQHVKVSAEELFALLGDGSGG